MRRLAQIPGAAHIVLVILALSQAGCVVGSDHPLVDPDNAKADERLFGQWRSTEKGRAGVGHVFFGRPPENSIRNAPKELTIAYVIEYGEKHELHNGQGPEFLLTTMIGSDHYVNLVGRTDPNKKLDEWKFTDMAGHTFAKYTVKDHRLTIWPLDVDATIKLVEAGKLKGRVTKNRLVELSESTESLRAFLQTDAGKALFIDKDKLVLQRVKW